jgi:L,D-peptidoglycan transpeptidase YkuD (ErfK/YbiS/YcfS/YnhG family)
MAAPADLAMQYVKEISVTASAVCRHHGRLSVSDRSVPCTLGPAGIVRRKREGDSATPAGTWQLRCLYYRADRLPRPRTGLAVHATGPAGGWCDAAGDRFYNRPVTLPYAASAETLFRSDHLYDLLVVLGHNDAPVVPGGGSCIFFHLMNPQAGPTEGCVAVSRRDMATILQRCGPHTRMRIG